VFLDGPSVLKAAVSDSGYTWWMVEQPPALSFGAAASAYDRFRPTYPIEAVQWAAGGTPPRRVADLGAGTGILTRALLSAGYEAVPVEPDPGMRARLDERTPDVVALAGAAEELPLPDGSVDAVVAGQSYHWFDRNRAHAEVARVLRPGGTFAPVWNLRDDTEPWVAEYSRLSDGDLHIRDMHEMIKASETFGPRFGPLERAEFRHSVTLAPTDLIALAMTKSYYLTATVARKRRLERTVRDLITEHPDLAGRETVRMPYRTVIYRAQVLRS
jgi:SAM-dependent methyltransferase